MNKNSSMPADAPRRSQIAKLCGADVELGNLVLGVESSRGTGALASSLLLREISGLPLTRAQDSACDCAPCSARRRALLYGTASDFLGDPCAAAKSSFASSSASSYNPQDWGRKFLRENGGCAYIDLDHLELCIPEVLSARDHVAGSHAMLRIANAALQSANAQLPPGTRIVALANSSDGQGHSYGSHLSFLLTRAAWNEMFDRKLQCLLVLAAYQVSSQVFTGQGKVGSENGRPPVDYQISQRADFFEVLVGPQTTRNRPLVNSRDEPLCGSWRQTHEAPELADLARLHVIFYDQTLAHVAGYLKVGVMQIVLSMMEAGELPADLILEDPVEAVIQWSHDPGLTAKARLMSGRWLTAVELQMCFAEKAQRFVQAGGCDGVVPEARQIVELWIDTLSRLERRDFDGLAGRIDWVLKMQLLERTRQQRPELDWGSAELKHLDFMYSSLGDGLYWSCERQGVVERVVSEQAIERALHEPPENTRAWTRAMLLRLAPPENVCRLDWDSLTFSIRDSYGWPSEITLPLPHPLHYSKTDCQQVFQASSTLAEVLDRLCAGPGGRSLISTPTSAVVATTAIHPTASYERT